MCLSSVSEKKYSKICERYLEFSEDDLLLKNIVLLLTNGFPNYLSIYPIIPTSIFKTLAVNLLNYYK